jgi:hypothetical protein
MSFESSHNSPEQDPDGIFISLTDSDTYNRYIRSVFKGGVVSWAKEVMRQQPGHVILPKQAYVKEDGFESHKVLWVEHVEFEASGHRNSLGHLAVCDCAGDSFSEELISCGIYERALHERAAYISRHLHIPEVLSYYEQMEMPQRQQDEAISNFLMDKIEEVLVIDREKPEEWVGNVKNGEHEMKLVTEIIGQPENTVRLLAEIMEWQDRISVDPEQDTIRLAA